MKKTTKKSKIGTLAKILFLFCVFLLGLLTGHSIALRRQIEPIQMDEPVCVDGQVEWRGNSGYSCIDGFWIFDRSKLKIESCAARFYVGAPNTTYENVKEKCKNGELK